MNKLGLIVDFHAHVFPDELAPKAGKVLLENINYIYHPVHDMTLSGLLGCMDAWKIDYSVTQPVVTKASQFKRTNDWAASTASDRIIPFGGLYPHNENFKEDIDYICSLGLKGIKFHPEYQNFLVDEPQFLRIYDYALSKGLILLFHAGMDPAMEPPYKSTPKQFAHIVKEMQGGVIVAAHFGGHAQWDEVERYLVGTDIYLDTSMGFSYYSKEQFERIVRGHGADKVLFASDSPWSNAKDEMEALMSTSLSSEEKEKILGGNAAGILGLNIGVNTHHFDI